MKIIGLILYVNTQTRDSFNLNHVKKVDIIHSGAFVKAILEYYAPILFIHHYVRGGKSLRGSLSGYGVLSQ